MAHFGLHIGTERLAEFLVRDAEDSAILHARHVDQHGLDLGRVDVDAARDHHVPGAVAEEQVAILVEVADVAAGHQAVAPDLAALFIEATINEVGKAFVPDVNLADLAGRQHGTRLVVYAHGGKGQGLAHGAGFFQRLLAGDEDHGTGLGAAVVFVDHRAPPLDHAALDLGRTGRRSVHREFQRR